MAEQAIILRGPIVLRVVGGAFTPDGHRASTFITAKFKERVCSSGDTWKHVDRETNDFYYQEFCKRYTWDEGQEALFVQTWEACCARLYREHLYYMRKKGVQPVYVPDDIWALWSATWASDRWQTNSSKALTNKNTEPGGPGTGLARHTSGSRSMVEHTHDLERSLQRPPTCWEVFSKTYKKKDDTWVDSRSQAIHETMTSRVSEASQSEVEGLESQPMSTENINDIYYDVVGGRRKNYSLYGLGSQAKVVYDQLRTPRGRASSSSSSSSTSDYQRLREDNERLLKRVNEQDLILAEHDRRFESQRVESQLRWEHMQKMIAGFTQSQSHGIASQETQDPAQDPADD